jgi:predicted RNA binding protein YcfA (HicA-like mRNA interferase family)
MKLERNSRKLIKLLTASGWYLVEAKGSHHQFKHPQRPGRVTVPHPNHDLPKGTVHSIYRQAGWFDKQD